jgi:hypothetical protein
MFISVFARRLKPGKTYEDFLAAWYPEKGFGVPTRGPFVARNIADDREVLVVGFIDLPDRASLDEAMARLASQEQVRHDRIAEVIESTTLRGIYEVSDEFDFSTDATVAAGRPTR